jgi:ATP-binding cassette subfamily B protein
MSTAPVSKDQIRKFPKISNFEVVKTYLRVAQHHWVLGTLTLLGWIIATFSFSIISPIYYKKFFDVLTSAPLGDSATITSLFQVVYTLLLINIIGWAGFRLAGFSTTYFQSKVVKRLSEMAFDYIIFHSHNFFTNNFAGSITQRVNRFSRSFMRFSDQIIESALPLTIKIVGSIVVLYLTIPIISYMLFGWIIVFLTVSYIFAKIKLKYDVLSAAADSKMIATLSDSVSNHSVVQLFNGYKNESNLFRKATANLTNLAIFRWNLSSVSEALQSGVSVIIEFLMFYYGIKYWSMGLLSIGTFVLIRSYLSNVEGDLWGFGRLIRNVYEAIADGKEMVEILHLPHEIKNIKGAQELLVPQGAIEFRDVVFGFSENRQVFKGLNLSIKPGEKVAIIGSSGAGKSTLVKLLLRLHDIQGGEILIDGKNIAKVTQESLRENVSLVPQDPALFHRTLMENIRYGKRDASDAEVLEASKMAHCDVFIQDFPYQYETFVGERGVKLSGGERQRVAIARALLKNAPILVLDEATSSLDSHSESLIQDALHTLMKGKTTIVIAHRLSTIRKMDRIIVLGKEGIVEEGSHDELLTKEGGTYAKAMEQRFFD